MTEGTSDFRLGKVCKRKGPTDRISQLPDDILVYVLELLTLKDAGKTSVLSTRWVNLWKLVTRLDFDASKDLEYLTNVNRDLDSQPASREKYKMYLENKMYFKMRRQKNRKYVKWVSKVLESHNKVSISDLKMFRICFTLNISHQDHIDKWLQYVFSTSVGNIELSFGSLINLEEDPYPFPVSLLNSSLPQLAAFKSVRALTFCYLQMSDEVVEFFLHNCPFLERLVLVDIRNVHEVKVCGQSLALKHLELSCPCLRSVMVRDTNIVSLKTLEGHVLVLENVPKLVDVFISGCALNLNFITGVLSWLSCCLSDLEVLTIQTKPLLHRLQKDEVLPQLPKLKQFTLFATDEKDHTLLAFTSVIRASPNLEKFTLKCSWPYSPRIKLRNRSKKGVSLPLQRLKIVEFLGYCGRITEVELVEYFLQNAVALEKIVVDPHDHPIPGIVPRTGWETKLRKIAKEQLEGLVPSQIELVIL